MSTKPGDRRTRCSVDRTGRHLRLIYSLRGTRVRCTTKHRVGDPEAEAKAVALADVFAEMLANRHDPREIFHGDPRLRFSPGIEVAPAPVGAPPAPAFREFETIESYFRRWFASKTEGRKSGRRDYRRHVEGYVLPRIGSLPISDFDARPSYAACATSSS